MNSSSAQLSQWLAVAVALAFFLFLLARRLARAKYSFAWSLGLSALALAPSIFVVSPDLPPSLLFAFSIYAVACAVADFAEWHDPRRIIVLGSSLACAEIVNPAGGILAAVSLPFVLRIPALRDDVQRAAGLLILLLFIPMLAGIVMLYMSLTLHASTSQLLGISEGLHGNRLNDLIASLLTSVSILPALLRSYSLSAPSATAMGWIAITFAAGTFLAPLLGAGHHSMGLLIAMGPLSTVLVSSWPNTESRLSDTVAVSVSGLVLSWPTAWYLRFSMA